MGGVSVHSNRFGAGHVAGSGSSRGWDPYSIGPEAMHHDVDGRAALSNVWNDHNLRIDGGSTDFRCIIQPTFWGCLVREHRHDDDCFRNGDRLPKRSLENDHVVV